MNQENLYQLHEILNNFHEMNVISIQQDQRISMWELMLGVVSKVQNFELYMEEKSMLEQTYENLKKTTLLKLNKQNPLDLEASNFSNACKKLKVNIEKDIRRTYQEYAIFHSPEIQDKMTNTLLVWGLLNPIVSYGQGMNELVGLIIHADPNVTEATLYYIFDAIMNKLGHSDAYNYSKKKISIKENPLLKRILNIYNSLLRNYDLELFRFLSLSGLSPEIFMIRWVKCLLSREFDVTQSLLIWDHLFKEYYQTQQSGIDLLDFMIIKMIDMAKERLYEEENSFEMIRYLLNYPTNMINLQNFIADSVSIQTSPRIKDISYSQRFSDQQSNSSYIMELTQTMTSSQHRDRESKARDGCSGVDFVDMFQYMNFYTAPVKLFFKLSKTIKDQSNQKELTEVLKK